MVAMKHRSTGIFIIVLAALVAAPSASQQLLALKDAAAGRLEATLWDAFLSLNGHHAEPANADASPIRQVAPVETAASARARKAEAAPKLREAARPEPRRAAGGEDAWADEHFVAQFKKDERLFAFDPEAEAGLRMAVPVELPFELDRLIKSAHVGARADVLVTRARAAEAAGAKLKVRAPLPEVALKGVQGVRTAPRARGAKDTLKRLPAAGVQHDAWERPGVSFDFDYNESEKTAPRHAGESQTRN